MQAGCISSSKKGVSGGLSPHVDSWKGVSAPGSAPRERIGDAGWLCMAPV